MKSKGKGWFFVISALIIIFTVFLFTGINTKYGDTVKPVLKSVKDVRFGADFQDGIDVSFAPADEEVEATEKQMKAAQQVMQSRIGSLSITDYELYIEKDNQKMVARLPKEVPALADSPYGALNDMAAQGLITFREGAEQDEQTGEPLDVTAENIFLDSDAIQKATAKYGAIRSPDEGEHYVELKLTKEGAKEFADATEKIAKDTAVMSIWLDNTMISAISITQKASGNTAIISGNYDITMAETIADIINAGPLPFKMKTDGFTTQNPRLGTDALQAIATAVLVAFVLVIAYIIYRYKLVGAIASIGLLGLLGFTVAIQSGFFAVFDGFPLSLAGIVGVLLTFVVGIACYIRVAGNIDRHIKGGKNVEASLQKAFQESRPFIFTVNTVLLIISVVIIAAFGPSTNVITGLLNPLFFAFKVPVIGSLYTFAIPLLFGAFINTIFALVINQLMLLSVAGMKRFDSPALFTMRTKENIDEEEPIEKESILTFNKKPILIIVGIVAVAAIALSFTVQPQLDMVVTGGSYISYTHENDVNTASVGKTVRSVLGSGSAVTAGELNGGKSITVTLADKDAASGDTVKELTKVLNKEHPSAEFEHSNTVALKPIYGLNYLLKAVVALALAYLAVIVYNGVRYKTLKGWQNGLLISLSSLAVTLLLYTLFIAFKLSIGNGFLAAVFFVLIYSQFCNSFAMSEAKSLHLLYGETWTHQEIALQSATQSRSTIAAVTITLLLALVTFGVFAAVYQLTQLLFVFIVLAVSVVATVAANRYITVPLWAAK